MAHGPASASKYTQPVRIADSANLDAFSRLRVSSPEYVFDAQFTYDLQPLLVEQIVSGTGATAAHDAVNRCSDLAFSASPTGSKAYLQTFEYFRYQPGRSQQIFISFNFEGEVTDCLKFAGLSDGVNGIEFQSDGTNLKLVRYSDTEEGDLEVLQSSWSLDKLDGSGSSGLTLDVTKTQILVIDFQALYAGRVRVGFDINGVIVYVHEFMHSNVALHPYIQTASLPIRVGMVTTGNGVTATMHTICMSVSSEGGQQEELGIPGSFSTSVSVGSGTDSHAISLRPRATFNALTNRSKFVIDSVEILGGNASASWRLVIGQALSGTTTYTNVNTTYSAVEYNTAGTLSGSPTMTLAGGYVASSAAARGSTSRAANLRIPLTLDAAGAPRINGTLTLIMNGVGGASTAQVTINWRELR